MKTLRLLTIAATAVALIFGLGAMTAAAAGAPVNTDPGHAIMVDNTLDNIPAGMGLWYRFDYAGDKSQILLTLLNGNLNGLQFEVFTPTQIADWWDETPIGRGTSQSGSDDLTWNGNFNMPGTYYVQVINPGMTAMGSQLMIQGSGVMLSTSMTPSAPAQQAPTQAVAAAAGSVNDPGRALFIDNQPHTVPANIGVWYKFNYAGDKSQILLTLVSGNLNGLQANVFTPTQIGDWFNETPIGRLTPQMVNCTTGEVQENGGCQSDDLVWSGNFNAPGIYYVQIVNNAMNPVPTQLLVTGDGVTMTP